MSDTLKEELTGNYYVIVRPERCIKAFDQNQKALWTCKPYESREYLKLMKLDSRTFLNPDSVSIHAIDFPKTEYMGGSKGIVVYFSDRIVGLIDKKSGLFSILGQN